MTHPRMTRRASKSGDARPDRSAELAEAAPCERNPSECGPHSGRASERPQGAALPRGQARKLAGARQGHGFEREQRMELGTQGARVGGDRAQGREGGGGGGGRSACGEMAGGGGVSEVREIDRASLIVFCNPSADQHMTRMP